MQSLENEKTSLHAVVSAQERQISDLNIKVHLLDCLEIKSSVLLAIASSSLRHVPRYLRKPRFSLRRWKIRIYLVAFSNRTCPSTQNNSETLPGTYKVWAFLSWASTSWKYLFLPIYINAISFHFQRSVITPTNHNRSKQRYEPIRISSNYLQLAQSEGKISKKVRSWVLV